LATCALGQHKLASKQPKTSTLSPFLSLSLSLINLIYFNFVLWQREVVKASEIITAHLGQNKSRLPFMDQLKWSTPADIANGEMRV